jgi:hypothetical protein
MKDLLPSNYRLIKKRRQQAEVLSASMDSTLRMPSGLANKAFGIRKMEPREIREQHL